MSQKDPQGTYLHAIHRRTLSWAVSEIVRSVDGDLARLKVGSGEYEAAALTTAFLGTPPRIDTHGEQDLVFDLAQRAIPNQVEPYLAGRADVQFVDFEVKSLPGKYQQFKAEIDKAIAAGVSPKQTSMDVTIRSANDVLREPGLTMIEKARQQLARKSAPDRARNVFLVAHLFNHPIVEMTDGPILAHHLDDLALPDGVDSVWVFFAPHSLAVWSGAHRRWTNLIFDAINPDEDLSDTDDDLDLLQQIEVEFLRQTGTALMSPNAIRLTWQEDDHTESSEDTDP